MRIEIEDRLGAGLVARLHAVAGQAEDVGDAHRRGAQHVALDGDAVAVAAGDLHDDGVAHAGQQRADADRRHVAVGARRIDGVDGVDPALEDRGAVVDVLRVGGVGRVQLGRHRELAAPKHALQPPARGMAGQRDRAAGGRRPGSRRDGADHADAPPWRRLRALRPPALSRAARPRFRAANGRPASARSRIASPPVHLASSLPTPAPRRRACPARPRNGRWRARRRRGRCAAASGSSSGTTCRSRRGCTARTCGSRRGSPSRAFRRI